MAFNPQGKVYLTAVVVFSFQPGAHSTAAQYKCASLAYLNGITHFKISITTDSRFLNFLVMCLFMPLKNKQNRFHRISVADLIVTISQEPQSSIIM